MGLLDSGIGEGLNQASGTILQTGMNLMKFKQDKLMQEQKLQIEQDHVSRANKLLDMQIAEKQKSEELVPIEETLSKFGFKSPEEHQLFISKVPLDIEQIGGVNYIPRGKGIAALQKHSSDPEFNIQLGEIRTSNFNKTITEIDNQLGSPDSKLKPEQVQQLQEQRAALVTQRTQTANAMKIEQLKLKNARLINVPQGTDVIDPLNPEKPVYSNPKEAKPEKPLVIPEGGVLMGADGKPIYKNPKTFKDTEDNSKVDKAVDKADKKISEHIRVYYDVPNQKLQSRLDKVDANSPEGIRLQKDIDYNNAQAEIARDTQNKLRNGDIKPKDIRWGGNSQSSGKTVPKSRQDFSTLVKEAKDAIAKGADPVAVKKRLKEKGYNGTI
jgi:hypothetical protein